MKFFRSPKTLWLVIATSVLLSACGLRLRGDYLLPPELQTLYVSSIDKHGEITRLFKQQLAQNNVTVLKTFDRTKPEIRIIRDRLDRRNLSVFSNGQVAEYELIYTVQYQLHRDNYDPVDFQFEVNRDYQDDPSVALAKSRELNLILSEMRKTAVDRMIRDIATIQL